MSFILLVNPTGISFYHLVGTNVFKFKLAYSHDKLTQAHDLLFFSFLSFYKKCTAKIFIGLN